jgi:hypothetical protein
MTFIVAQQRLQTQKATQRRLLLGDLALEVQILGKGKNPRLESEGAKPLESLVHPVMEPLHK